MQRCHDIDRMGFPVDCKAINAEFEFRADLPEGCVRTFTASQAVSENTDLMAALGLSCSEIEDVTKYSAHRRANGMQNAERRIGRLGHRQNQRSATTTVSPGFRSVPGGTTA